MTWEIYESPNAKKGQASYFTPFGPVRGKRLVGSYYSAGNWRRAKLGGGSSVRNVPARAFALLA